MATPTRNDMASTRTDKASEARTPGKGRRRGAPTGLAASMLGDLAPPAAGPAADVAEASVQRDSAAPVAEAPTAADPASTSALSEPPPGSERQPEPAVVAPVQERVEPLYTRLERKELRVWPHQNDDLAQLTRKVNRARRSKGGERITDNTLIRVAIDLLLAHQDQLKGDNESELRASVLQQT